MAWFRKQIQKITRKRALKFLDLPHHHEWSNWYETAGRDERGWIFWVRLCIPGVHTEHGYYKPGETPVT